MSIEKSQNDANLNRNDLQGVYSVYDQVSCLFGFPVLFPRDAVATRNFVDLVSSSGTVLNSHPADFSLKKIGYFDEHTGEIIPCPIEIIAQGSDISQRLKEQGAAVGGATPLKQQSDTGLDLTPMHECLEVK